MAISSKQARQQAFLKAYAVMGVVTHAAAAAEIHRSLVYDWLKEEGADAEAFREAFDDAREQATDRLEREAVRRATEGVERYVTCSRGLVYGPDGEPIKEIVYSDPLLQFLLKGNRPEKYGVTQVQHSGQVGVNIQQLLSDIDGDTEATDREPRVLPARGVRPELAAAARAELLAHAQPAEPRDAEELDL